MKESIEALFHASKEVGLKVSTEKTKYMLMSRHHKSEQNHKIKRAHRSFENVAEFRNFGTTSNESKFYSGGN
jgi:hypothetical protein